MVKAIFFTTALVFSGAVPGHCQAPSIPVTTSVINTAGGLPTIAPNTWLEIHGANLAQTTMDWSQSNFLNGLPTTLGGVSATIDNKPAAIYYISPTQINVLAPLDTATGQEIMALFARLHRDGNTVVLVTHENDIAQHAHRIIHIRDGKVERDETVGETVR